MDVTYFTCSLTFEFMNQLTNGIHRTKFPTNNSDFKVLIYSKVQLVFLFIFYRSTFVGSAWPFVFSSPPQRPMTSDFKGFSIPDFIHYIYFPLLILEFS